jgi:multiple sugar transport system substrate-binding protein
MAGIEPVRTAQGGKRMRTSKLRVALAVLVGAAALALSACGGGDSSSDNGFSDANPSDLEGQEIKVLMPYKVPQELLDQFTNETGIDVQYSTGAWDGIASKLVVANQAGTYIADVTEFDWSFTGQFGGNGWYEPLQDVLDPKLLDDLGNTKASFTTEGDLYAACYSNDFKISMYNSALFDQAGLDTMPETFSDLDKTLDTLKAQGVADSAMTLPMAATEGSVTPWFLITLAMGGQLFDDNYAPQFADPNSAGYKALQWEVDALNNGWVSPGSVTLDDGPALERFTGGAAAVALSAAPGNLPEANDPKASSIAGDAQAALVPGETGPGASFGLQEGFGIPVTAEHKDAAKVFIDWMLEPEHQVELYKGAGFLPCGKTALDQLAKSGDLEGGDVITQEFDQLQPLFPNGAPKWYSQFSSEAQGLLNAAFKGDMSVGDALNQLADRATELAQSS